MGSNTTEAHPIIANRMKKAAKSGLKMIVIDPSKIDMVKSAHRHLPIQCWFRYCSYQCHDSCHY